MEILQKTIHLTPKTRGFYLNEHRNHAGSRELVGTLIGQG